MEHFAEWRPAMPIDCRRSKLFIRFKGKTSQNSRGGLCLCLACRENVSARGKARSLHTESPLRTRHRAHANPAARQSIGSHRHGRLARPFPARSSRSNTIEPQSSQGRAELSPLLNLAQGYRMTRVSRRSSFLFRPEPVEIGRVSCRESV